MKRFPKRNFQIGAQPNDTTCGPTCLQSVYQYFGDTIDLEKVIKEVQYLTDGGTIAVFLGNHALKRDYDVTIYTYNLQVFDPTWFQHSEVNVKEKLIQQLKFKKNKKLEEATHAYIEFLNAGGKILFEPLTSRLINQFLKKSIPVLTGLSATYLYQNAREIQDTMVSDDIRGTPTGHFVVLYGNNRKRRVLVADPYEKNPFSRDQKYKVKMDQLIGAILLGALTYDANLLVIQKKKESV